jgi:hypothetical protein
VEPAGGERKEAWRNLLKGLVERGLRGVRLVISDDHPSIRQAVMAELPGASWQRCVVHFMRNVLAHVPQSERGVVAEELQEVFVARRRGTAESLARGFVERYRDRFTGGRWRCLPRVWLLSRQGNTALPGHEPALGCGRETHKNRDLTLINTEALIEKFLRIVPESQERFGSLYTF